MRINLLFVLLCLVQTAVGLPPDESVFRSSLPLPYARNEVFTDVQDTRKYLSEYGHWGKVIKYRFTLSENQDVVIHHFGSETLEPSKIYLYRLLEPREEYEYFENGRIAAVGFSGDRMFSIGGRQYTYADAYYQEQRSRAEVRSDSSNAPRYGGGISGMDWKAGYGLLRSYNFTYDGQHRLMRADYRDKESDGNRFGTSYAYDTMGNILSLQRNGLLRKGSYGTTDNLCMTYDGNRLVKAEDSGDGHEDGLGFTDGSHSEREYRYDGSGNMTADLNKGIELEYNFLNLPSIIRFSGKGSDTLHYLYTPDGSKLACIGRDMRTDYVGNKVYENGRLKRILVEGGYLEDGRYYFFLQDHLGNNRVVADESGNMVQQTHYYPFGIPFADSTSPDLQPYKYNGKELEKSLSWYDYGARRYDAVLGRFTSQDRYAEKYYSLSPYQYAGNNPITFIDVNGDSIIISPNSNGWLDRIRILIGFDTEYQQAVKKDLRQLKKDDSSVRDMIEKLEKSSIIHEITMPKRGEFNATVLSFKIADKGIPQRTTIWYDPNNRKTKTGNFRTPRVGLAHELQHSFDADVGTFRTLETENGIKLMDVKAINTENRIRKVTGDPKRTKYVEGKEVPEWLLE